jgi:hypothetical protein
VKSRLWGWVFLLTVFVILGWFVGAGASWHVVTYIGISIVVLAFLVNIVNGFIELRQRRRGNG